ncbi:alpha/beta fold hydrolase [Pedobacter sp. HMF7647]|uniref:Alpha/beta fold hydrolase n=1 Tax=Hufsiella arboris TaxID=2695275 RepID=A0A7K1YD97_9SPHI|nr:alpha/beta hydrolase [Hufsiella arboris]MXV52555.1 alpha/beta fold hydrolase [Hufsiella arboris]
MADISNSESAQFKGHALVNGVDLYYEIYGRGEPLVLIPGGGSTIECSFGRILSRLAEKWQVITLDLQNHGRSGFRDFPQTFEQDADDVAGLLKHIGVSKANFLGFSNGGTTAMQIALRFPELVEKLIAIAATCKRDGLIQSFFEGMAHVTLADMPQQLKDAFLAVNPDEDKLQISFERDRDRMLAFEDWSDEQIKAIVCPTLIINGDRDVTTIEHSLELHRLIAGSRLAIIPGVHGEYIGEILSAENDDLISATLKIINNFLNENNAKP